MIFVDSPLQRNDVLETKELFEVLAREHSRMLTTYLLTAGCDQALADDVWQETMIVAWKKLDEFDRSLAFGPWLRGIAAKVLMSARRKSGRLHLVGDEAELNYLSERLDRVDSLAGDTLDEKLDALRDCISLLSDSDRECIELRFRDDLMPAAICERNNGCNFVWSKELLEPERKQQLDNDLLETLLREAFAQPQQDDDRILDLMSKLEPTRIEPATRLSLKRGLTLWRQVAISRFSRLAGEGQTPFQTEPSISHYGALRRRTITFAIAATLFLAVGTTLLLIGQSNPAYAAVMRSIGVVPPTREYRITMLHQFPFFGQRTFDAELYLDDSSRFVVHHPGWNGLAEFWVGGSVDARWIVPKNGPAFTGDDQMIAGWLSKRGIPSPYLHVTTILERLSRNYKLELLADEQIPDASDESKLIGCQHIVGTADADVANRPWKIELWVDVDSGVARRVVLNWKCERLERGPVQWTIELVGSPVLPDDWFQLDGHIESGRPTIRLQSEPYVEDLGNQ